MLQEQANGENLHGTDMFADLELYTCDTGHSKHCTLLLHHWYEIECSCSCSVVVQYTGLGCCVEAARLVPDVRVRRPHEGKE